MNLLPADGRIAADSASCTGRRDGGLVPPGLVPFMLDPPQVPQTGESFHQSMPVGRDAWETIVNRQEPPHK